MAATAPLAAATQNEGPPSPLPTATPQLLDTVLVWFRRDLRVDDNVALLAALQASRNVVPVFVWAPEEEGQFQPGRCGRWWTKQSVIDFQAQLEGLGSRLIIRQSPDSGRALQQLVIDTGAQALFFNHLYDPISLVRDHEVKQLMARLGVLCRGYNADLLYEPWEVLDGEQQPFTCFKDFWDRVKRMPYPPAFPLSAPPAVSPVHPVTQSLPIDQVKWFLTQEQEHSSNQLKHKWQPGAEGSAAALERFLSHRLHIFQGDRAKVDRESTSQLSPWIHSGALSVRYIYYSVRQHQSAWRALGDGPARSCEDFLQQLGYREYSRYLSFHFPFITERALLAHLRACPWHVDQFAFKAWKQGLTGYPLVDSAMKQLWATGWCHNRMRVMAASFAVKNLLLPWQWGLKHFWDAQLDADLECDALGWQYVSGGMTDARPFSHQIDHAEEARSFDPDGMYVRRWLPVLSRLPNRYIHAPWEAPPEVLQSADVELGFNYPQPIISVEGARKRNAHACAVLDKHALAQPDDASKHPYRKPNDLSSGQPYMLGSSPAGVLGRAANGSRHAANGGAILSNSGGGGRASGEGSQRLILLGNAPLHVHRRSLGSGAGGTCQPKRQRSAYNGSLVEASAENDGTAPRRYRPDIPNSRRDAWYAVSTADGTGGGDSEEEEGEEEGAASEEVVSNTIGLSVHMPSGCSVLLALRHPGGTAAAARAEQARQETCKQEQPHRSAAEAQQQQLPHETQRPGKAIVSPAPAQQVQGQLPGPSAEGAAQERCNPEGAAATTVRGGGQGHHPCLSHAVPVQGRHSCPPEESVSRPSPALGQDPHALAVHNRAEAAQSAQRQPAQDDLRPAAEMEQAALGAREAAKSTSASAARLVPQAAQTPAFADGETELQRQQQQQHHLMQRRAPDTLARNATTVDGSGPGSFADGSPAVLQAMCGGQGGAPVPRGVLADLAEGAGVATTT